MKSKLSIVIVILIAILLIVTSFTTIYYFKCNKDLNLELNNLKIKVQEYESKGELEKNDENIEPEEFKNSVLNESFFTEKGGEVHLYPHEYYGSGNDIWVNVTLKENNELYISVYGDSIGLKKGEFKVDGINGKIVEARPILIGNGNTPTILILMEDGTVEYVKLQSNFEGEHLVSSGKIEGLNNVVRIIPISLTRYGGGYASFAVIENDGTSHFIDPQFIIEE